MNYIKESRSFREWIYRNSPSMGQIALWYALFDLCNQTGWKEWFNAANNTLMLGSGLSRPGIVKCREFLKEQGLIDFKTYGPNKAADYRMIPFTSQKVDIEVDVPVDIDESTSQKVDIPVANELAFPYRIPKQETKTNNNSNTVKSFSLYQNEIGIVSSSISQQLQDDVETYGDEWVCDAIKEAVKNNVRKYVYISSILNKWKTSGRGSSNIAKTGQASRSLTESEWKEQERMRIERSRADRGIL